MKMRLLPNPKWASTTLGLLLVFALSAAGYPVTVLLAPGNAGSVISRDFIGLSFEVALLLPQDGKYYFRSDNTDLINLFHTLGIKHLRVGGNTADRDAHRLPSESDLDSFFAFAKAADVKVIYCLQLYQGDPHGVVKTAKYIMDHYAPLMDSFSIGQEPSAYPKLTGPDVRPDSERMGAAAEKYPYSAYREAWKVFATDIIAAAPGVRFCGPSVHNNGVWAREFMSDFGQSNHVVLVTEHLYPGGAGGRVPTPGIGIDRMLAGDTMMTNSFPKAYARLYNSFVPLAVANGLPYRLEEVNNYFNGGATNVSNTFASALWGLDFLWWWAAHGAAGLDFHTGDRVAIGNNLQPSKYAAYYTTTNGYCVRPLGYGLKAFALGSHGQMIPAGISNSMNLNITAYATHGYDKCFYVTLINKEHGIGARSAEVAITSSQFFSGGGAMFLAASGGEVAATTGVTLGGAEIKPDASWPGTWQKLISSNGAIAVEIPAATAAVVRLFVPPLSASEPQTHSSQ